jgi:CheY-like chemotaxis protein
LIALTGWGQQQDRRRTQEAGFDAHLTKPVNYDAIMDLLKKLPSTTLTAANQQLSQ